MVNNPGENPTHKGIRVDKKVRLVPGADLGGVRWVRTNPLFADSFDLLVLCYSLVSRSQTLAGRRALIRLVPTPTPTGVGDK